MPPNSICLKAAIAFVELCREIGNSAALRPFVKREVMPGDVKGSALEHFIRDASNRLCPPTLQSVLLQIECLTIGRDTSNWSIQKSGDTLFVQTSSLESRHKNRLVRQPAA